MFTLNRSVGSQKWYDFLKYTLLNFNALSKPYRPLVPHKVPYILEQW